MFVHLAENLNLLKYGSVRFSLFGYFWSLLWEWGDKKEKFEQEFVKKEK